ncbi:MAG: DUF2147 domain-containing protein [Pseudomonadota bacterium]
MKKLMLASVIALAPSALFADDVFGTWKSAVNAEGNFLVMTVAACGAKICGTISDVSSGGDQSVIGKKMLWDMEARGNGSYRGGRIWAADTGKEYRSKMSLSGNTLSTSGCVGPICRSVDWARQ